MYSSIRWQQRFQHYEQAIFRLTEALERTAQNPDDKLLQAGALQTYEFSIELAWKTLKDYLEEKGVIVLNPTETIRHAFQQNFIKDAELWLEALKARNLSSHAYDQKLAMEILLRVRESYAPLLFGLYEFFKSQK